MLLQKFAAAFKNKKLTHWPLLLLLHILQFQWLRGQQMKLFNRSISSEPRARMGLIFTLLEQTTRKKGHAINEHELGTTVPRWLCPAKTLVDTGPSPAVSRFFFMKVDTPNSALSPSLKWVHWHHLEVIRIHRVGQIPLRVRHPLPLLKSSPKSMVKWGQCLAGSLLFLLC